MKIEPPMIYRNIKEEELCMDLFSHFERRQEVKNCWRKEGGRWVIREESFVDDWGPEEYRILVQCLHHTLENGGAVFGAFQEGQLKGFASVEEKPLGSKGQYRDLSSLHVSQEKRGFGIGKALFRRAADWARAKGAEKLYISSHSAVETQAFYRAMGCVEAKEYQCAHVQQEPYDCQLEYPLTADFPVSGPSDCK